MTEDRKQLEHAIQNEIRNALVDECYLYRANVGRGYQGEGKPFKTPYPITVNMNPGDVLLRNGRPFDTGLPPGFSDLLGGVPVVITPDMVGSTVMVSAFVEVKNLTGSARDLQISFINAMRAAGARAGFARSVDDARNIIKGNYESLSLQPGIAQDRNSVTGKGRRRT